MVRTKPRKDVPITIRIPKRIFDFYEAYAAKFGITKKSILENKALEKFDQINQKKKLTLFHLDLSIDELKKKVSEDKIREATRGDEKFVIFVDPYIDEFVKRLSYTMLLKPTDIYRLLLLEFYGEHRNELSEEDLELTRSAKVERIKEVLE